MQPARYNITLKLTKTMLQDIHSRHTTTNSKSAEIGNRPLWFLLRTGMEVEY